MLPMEIFIAKDVMPKLLVPKAMDLDVELDFFKLETRKCISSDLFSTNVTYYYFVVCYLQSALYDLLTLVFGAKKL